MSVFNLGSINIDNFYRVVEIPMPGETTLANGFNKGLGGKGANMSVALARGAARAIHIGAVGGDGAWCVERLTEYGVDTRYIETIADASTGHANINVAEDGENQIVVFPGTNHQISGRLIHAALAESRPDDTLLFQNETCGQRTAAKIARERGLTIIYAAAPFSAASVAELRAFADILVLNEVEAQQLTDTLGVQLPDVGASHVIVTKGGDGVTWLETVRRQEKKMPALPVVPVDTTGAGDTFTGFLVAGLDRGMPMEQALTLATRAGAIMVTRHGTADVIPDLKDIEEQFGSLL